MFAQRESQRTAAQQKLAQLRRREKSNTEQRKIPAEQLPPQKVSARP